jgi:hypothetical protein
MYATGAKISRSGRSICFSRLDTTWILSYLRGWGMYFQECVVKRRVHTDQRWVQGVRVGGGKPGSSARVQRSLDVDQPSYVEPAEKGQHDNNTEEDCRVGRSGEVWWRGVLEDQPPPGSVVLRV